MGPENPGLLHILKTAGKDRQRLNAPGNACDLEGLIFKRRGEHPDPQEVNVYCCRIPLQEDDGPYVHSTSSMHSGISTLVSRIYADLCMRDATTPSDLVALPLLANLAMCSGEVTH